MDSFDASKLKFCNFQNKKVYFLFGGSKLERGTLYHNINEILKLLQSFRSYAEGNDEHKRLENIYII